MYIITPTNAPKINIILFLKVSYMFRPCWAIFRGDTSQKEDEAQGTFALNYINATIVYQYYSP
jgi:hypothetical protein